ncbi:hypothetical protein [Paenibacillus sp. MSJ-34]|nr:hypothetical protein [Paenibacillus sp. MSJ-34]
MRLVAAANATSVVFGDSVAAGFEPYMADEPDRTIEGLRFRGAHL